VDISSNILMLLWGAFPDDQKKVADLVLTAKGKTVSEQMRILTQVERTPGLPVDLFGLTASAKIAITGGEKEFESFKERALRCSGLL